MIFNLTLLIIGLLLAFTLIGYKMWLLRTGKIVAGSYEEADWTDLSVENIRYHLIELLKITIHKTILSSLKGWILFTHFIRKTDKRVKAKLVHLITKNGHSSITPNQKPSEFLSNIRDHKNKMTGEIPKE